VRVAILLLVLCVGRSQGPPLRDLSKLAEQMDDASISFNIYVSHEGVNQTVELSWRPRDDSADDRKQRAYGQCWLKLKGCSFNWLFRFRRPVSLSLSLYLTHAHCPPTTLPRCFFCGVLLLFSKYIFKSRHSLPSPHHTLSLSLPSDFTPA